MNSLEDKVFELLKSYEINIYLSLVFAKWTVETPKKVIYFSTRDEAINYAIDSIIKRKQKRGRQ